MTKAAAPLTAAILGATGAVGKELVGHLTARDQWSKIIVLNRRLVSYPDSPKIEQHVVPMTDDASLLEKASVQLLGEADALFVTMGVGAPSKGDEATLRRVDVELPSACARGAKAAGRIQLVSLLSSVGANAHAKPDGALASALMPKTRAGGGLYLQCKGQVEHNLASLGFAKAVSTFRPAALVGTPNTPGAIAAISPVMDKLLPPLYQSSDINTLAAAMVYDAETQLLSSSSGSSPATDNHLRIFHGKTLRELYKSVPFSHGLKSSK